ncbi:hypothetical protein N0V82_003553 [Gnomoniopsis sp. IMI 355080]|nr:hypothetical protein N0V82_003553 [Gnomoniopsis sp. IMI 355080]
MATSPNLPLGAFITTLEGRRCTALPRTDINTQTTLTTTPLAPAITATATTTPSQAAQSEVLGSGTTTPFVASPTAGAQSTGVASASSAGSGLGNGSKSGSNGNGSTIAVAGGVIGGVALISLIAFFIWFWRRRLSKKRRDTLLTPLSADPSFGRDVRGEKGPYLIHRDSIGPTPRSTKVKAALRAQYGRVRGRFDNIARSASVRSASSHASGRSVDMNRGNSQFMDASPVNTHSRNNSSALSARDDSDMSIKERIMELWARFKGSGKQELAGDEKNDIFAARGIAAGGAKQRSSPGSRPLTNKPDFLTLLNMDDNELDREAQRLRMSRTRGGSEGSGLGGLNLDFGEDPFSDLNAVSSSNKPRAGPPMASGANNPFSDANAVVEPIPRKPATYIADIRRSRGQSVDSTINLNKAYDLRGLRVVNEEMTPAGGAAAAAAASRGQSFYRDSQVSAASFESFATKRDKFRSDPFDLEQLSSQVSGSIPNYTSRAMYDSAGADRVSSSGSISQQYQMSIGSLGPGILSRPAPAHTRHLSDSSSKYTSGISEGTLAEWSDPGPDVGSAATGRYDASRRSSGADVFNSFNAGKPSSSSSSRRSSRNGSIQMGYAL